MTPWSVDYLFPEFLCSCALCAHQKWDFAELWNKSQPEIHSKISPSPTSPLQSRGETQHNNMDLGCWRLQKIPCAVQIPKTPERSPNSQQALPKYSTGGCRVREAGDHSKPEGKPSRLPKNQILRCKKLLHLKVALVPPGKGECRQESQLPTHFSACSKARESNAWSVSDSGN